MYCNCKLFFVVHCSKEDSMDPIFFVLCRWYVLDIAISRKVNSSLHVLHNHNQRLLGFICFHILYESFLTQLKVKARIALPKLHNCGFQKQNKTKFKPASGNNLNFRRLPIYQKQFSIGLRFALVPTCRPHSPRRYRVHRQ